MAFDFALVALPGAYSSSVGALVDSFLRPPQGRTATVEDKRFYLKALLAAMWNYRFLHRDLEHLLDSDPELAARYRRFSQRCLQQGQAIYRGFVEAGILAMDAAQIESLTINAWIVLTSWVRFLSTTREHSAHLGEEAFKRGVYVFDHLIFSMHSLSFQGLLLTTIFLGSLLTGWVWWLIAAAPAHLFFHMRATYRISTLGTLIRMWLLFVGSAVAVGFLLLALVIVGAIAAR